MNEKECRIIVIITILFFLAVVFIQSIAYNQSARRTDTQIDGLTQQLDDARARVENCTRELNDCRGTFEKCYNSVGRIADSLNGQSEELSGIIENLKTVREEVENMENALNFFYIKYGYPDDDFNSDGGTVE